MNSHYFAQYLLNEGTLSQEAMSYLLGKARGKKVSLNLLAYRQGMVSKEDAVKLSGSPDFAKDVLDGGLLGEEDLLKLGKQHPGETLRFGQCLLDENILGMAELAEKLEKFDQNGDSPVKIALLKVVAGGSPPELDIYQDFMELFMESLMEFLETPAVIDNCPVEFFGTSKIMYAVSQRMGGSISVVSGIAAYTPDFVELARRYADEDIESVDELAIDSVQEFINVVNGVFSVHLANEKGIELDLELPRWGKVIEPNGHDQVALRIYTDFGSFLVVLAADEFM